MPLLILTAIISLVVGATLRSAGTAFAIAVGLGLVDVVQMVWVVTDGKGNDPGWWVAVGIAGLLANVGLAAAGRKARGFQAATA
jgi:hypothetical protein